MLQRQGGAALHAAVHSNVCVGYDTLAWAQVMTEYTTARALMQGMSSSIGIWTSLLQVPLHVLMRDAPRLRLQPACTSCCSLAGASADRATLFMLPLFSVLLCAQEVDKAVAAMVALLEPRLADATTPLPEAAEALHILLQLQADKAPCAADARPLELYLTTLVRHLSGCVWPRLSPQNS